MSDETNDTFTRWLLGITATVVVAIGGWLGVTLTTLNSRFGIVETQLASMNATIEKMADDTQEARKERELMKERIIRLELLTTPSDNTRVRR